MKRTILCSLAATLFSMSLLASDSEAVPAGGGGGGGGGGACFTCSCSVTGTVGGHTCYCASTSNGGSGCLFVYEPGLGTSCYVRLGPCLPAIYGFAP